MLSPAHNSAVVEWLSGYSKHPLAAFSLWSTLFVYMREDDGAGEIVLPDSEWEEDAGIEPDQAPLLLNELVSINALLRDHQGGRTRFFMNPWVATYIPDPDVHRTARERAGPLLVEMPS